MKKISHERALQLAAMYMATDVSNDEQQWLAAHLADCTACSTRVQQRQAMLNEMRSVSIAATSALVRTTKVKVRARAIEMNQRQSRRMSVWVAMIVALLWYGLSTPFLYEAGTYLAHWTNLPDSLTQVTMFGFWVTPALVGLAVVFGMRQQRTQVLN